MKRGGKNNDIEDSFKEYLERMLLPSSADYYYLDDNGDNDDRPLTLRLKKDVVQVRRLIAKHNDEDFDKFISEEVNKIIMALAESSSSSSSILSAPSISDGLKQHIQNYYWRRRRRRIRHKTIVDKRR